MKLTLKKVTRSMPDYGRIKALYNSSFPDDEKAPFFILMKNAKRPCADFRAVYSEDGFAGIAYTVVYKDIAYLFYLAVDKEQRGKGCGSAMLRALKKRYAGKRFFLALEQLDKSAENYDERVKRRQFYISNGFEDMHCRIREGRVVYDVMGIGGAVSGEEYKLLMRNYLGALLSRLMLTEMMRSP